MFEDDTGNYVNPYWPLYKTIKHAYYMQKVSGPSNLKRWTSNANMHLADKVIEVLGEHSWLVEERIGDIILDDGLNDKLRIIAKELGVKHREIGVEYNRPGDRKSVV